jgi:transposase
MDKLLKMSSKELSRVEVMQKLCEKRMSQKEASAMLHVSTRQIKRLLKTYRKKGAVGLVSKHRGRKESRPEFAEDPISRLWSHSGPREVGGKREAQALG